MVTITGATAGEQPNNKTDFSDCETVAEKVEAHRENVQETMERAKEGEVVNLSDLMGEAEELHLEGVQEQRGDA